MSKDNQTTKRKKVAQQNEIPSKEKMGLAVNKNIDFPEEFEEDRSMNIRMKPQPLATSVKNKQRKIR